METVERNARSCIKVSELVGCTMYLLIACFFKAVNAFIIPCAAYLSVCGDSPGAPQRAAAAAVLTFGVLWGVTGTVSAVYAILAPVP